MKMNKSLPGAGAAPNGGAAGGCVRSSLRSSGGASLFPLLAPGSRLLAPPRPLPSGKTEKHDKTQKNTDNNLCYACPRIADALQIIPTNQRITLQIPLIYGQSPQFGPVFTPNRPPASPTPGRPPEMIAPLDLFGFCNTFITSNYAIEQ
jgi:hypothetical protein